MASEYHLFFKGKLHRQNNTLAKIVSDQQLWAKFSKGLKHF